MKQNKICCFTAEVKRKQISQYDLINKLGMSIDVFSSINYENSKKYLTGSNRPYKLKAGFITRTKQIYQYLKHNKEQIHHMELFGGGRFMFIYVFFAKCFKIKILLIERGGMNEYIKKGNRKYLTLFSSYVLYKLADYCWYKEYYMKPHLDKLGVKNQHFIPNCIAIGDDFKIKKKFSERKIDYLWVNGVIPMRQLDWIVKLAASKEYQDKKFEIYGFLPANKYEYSAYSQNKLNEIIAMDLPNVTVKEFDENIMQKYGNAKFFVLAADYVFGNNSLLEAMSLGVVPIINNVFGSDNIVQNDRNGLLSEDNFLSYKKQFERSAELTISEWEALSVEAVNTVRESYSIEIFEKKLTALYASITP